MAKKKLLSVILAAFAAICLAAGVYLACGGSLFAFAENYATGNKLSIEKLGANHEYLTGAYIDAYGVPAMAIKEYTTDGNTESGSLSGIFDRNFSTAWRSKATVSESSVSLTVFFKEAYSLDGFIYQSEGGGRGYFTDLKISYHGASAFDNDPFEEYGTVQSQQTGDTVYVKFQEATEMTAIKIEWQKAAKSNGYANASAAEITFLQPQDNDVKQALEMFADYAQLELKPEVTEEKIKTLRENLEKKATKRAAWEAYLDPLLTRASQIFNKTLSLDTRREMSTADDAVNKLWRHGDVASYARNTLKFSNFGTNRQATGVSSIPGEKIIVYVDAEENDPLPSLVFSQHWGTAMMAWKSGEYTLHRGRNEVITPHLHYWGLHDNNGENCPRGGPIYLVNPYLPSEEEKPKDRPEKTQSNKVKVYIEGGTAIPTFRKGGDVESYLSDLRDYAELVEQDKLDNYETGNYTVVDVTEVVCDRMTLTVQATRGNEYYNELGYDPQKACENWDDYVKKLLMFDGIVFKEEDDVEGSEEFQKKLDSVNAKYDSRNEWLSVNIRLMQPWGAAYAAPEHVGIQVGWDGSGLIGEGWGWGYSHEIGHMLDITERLVGECSNNMISKFDETVLDKYASRGDFVQNVLNLAPDDHMSSYFNTNRLNFTIWWLIESYLPGYWAKLENLYRYGDLYELVAEERSNYLNDKGLPVTINATEKQIYYSSIVTGIDLRYYFERWGYNLSGSDKIFKAEESSALFQRMMQRATEQHLISDEFQPKLWYLDAAEWWARYDNASYADNPCYNDNFEKGSLYKETEPAPTITQITKTGSGYSLMIQKDSKFSDPNHLGYEVQVKQAGQTENKWKVVGFTSGRIFTDTTAYTAEEGYVPEYRLVAYDRALHHSKEGPSTSASATEVTDVCQLESEGQAAKKYTSVAQAVANAKDGDTIVLLKNSFESGIVINKAITIKTNGTEVTITKSGNAPIFTVVEETVAEEKRGEDGQVIEGEYVNVTHTGKLTLEGSETAKIILDGYEIETEGSLVHVQAGELKVKYCTFQNAIFKWGNDSMGGALRFEGGTLDVENTTFSNNSARLGGAVCVTHRNNSSINFKNCTFENNNAHEGGGVYNTSTITFEGCTFKGNSADSVGGGFANVSGGVITLKGCTFEENKAENRGGGFYSDGKVELIGGKFTGNTAADGAAFAYWRTSSGARYFSAKPSETDNKLPEISGNKSDTGAAVILHGYAETVKLDIQQNDTAYALRAGGELINLEADTKIFGNIFRENSGNVVLKALPQFKDSDITVATDSEQADLVLFTAGSDVTFENEFVEKFRGENGEIAKLDESRNQIVFVLNSYIVTFEMTYEAEQKTTETRHYRPGREFTFESFSGDKYKQWYVTKWTGPDGKTYVPGDTYKVEASVTFTATIATKYKIEYQVGAEFEAMGAQSSVFYVMPGEKYTLPKINVEGHIHNGWTYTDTAADGQSVEKTCQPVKSFRANRDRIYKAVIVKKLTVNYWIPSQNEGEGAHLYATKEYGYGSKIDFVNCDDYEYMPYTGFIEGFHIRYSNGTLSSELVDLETYQIRSDLDLVASVIEEAAMIAYVIYDDGYGGQTGEILDSKLAILEMNSTYTVDLLPIPTGYHLVELMLDGELVDMSTYEDYSFELTQLSYVFVAYVTKDSYSITYSCNGEKFRTDTMTYGSVLTFNDPTNTLLKEAVRKYEGLDDDAYHFINYQLVAPNPQAGEEGQPDEINLNVMLGDQLTVTGNMSINIVAYIEGYEYEADDSGEDVVDSWRSTHKTYISNLANELITLVNNPTLSLFDEERTKYTNEINAAVDKAVAELSGYVLYNEIHDVWTAFELSMGDKRKEITLQAAQNAAVSAVEAARDAALKAFESKESGEGVEEAKKNIETTANGYISSIKGATESSQFDKFVEDAKSALQKIVTDYDGDQLVLQRNNAITGVTGRAEVAKREIKALTYLSEQYKTEKYEEIDELLKEAIGKINQIGADVESPASLRVARVLRAASLEDFKGIDIEFANHMGIITYEAQNLNTAKKAQADSLTAYAAEVRAQINAALAAATTEIQEDGIILSNAELIASLTQYAQDACGEFTTILDAAIASIVEVYEEEDTYEDKVADIVNKAKAELGAKEGLVRSDIDTKKAEAEQKTRDDMFRLHVAEPTDSALARLEELTLTDRETFKTQLTDAQTAAQEGINNAEDIEGINAAIAEFNEVLAKVRLASEKESAQAVIDSTVDEAKATLESYDFLDESWKQNYTEQIENAAEVACGQIVAEDATADSVIAALGTFTATAKEVLSAALSRNTEKGEAEKTAAREGIAASLQSAKTAIDGLGFVTEDEKADFKAQLDAISSEADAAIEGAPSQTVLNETREEFNGQVESVKAQAQQTNDATAKEKKDAAKAEAEEAVEQFKEEIQALPYFTDENWNDYIDPVETRLEAVKAAIDAALSEQGIETVLSTFRQEIRTASATAAERNNQIKGDKVAGAIADAIKAVSEKVTEAQNKSDSFSFFDDAKKKAYSDQLDAALKAATDAINLAKDKDSANALQVTHIQAVEKIVSDTVKEHEAAKQAAQKEALNRVQALAAEAKTAVEALTNLGETAAQYTGEIDTALETATSAINSADAPDKIAAAISECETKVNASKAAAQTADVLAAEKSKASASVFEAKGEAEAAIEALGFLKEELDTYQNTIETAYTAATEAIGTATTTDDVHRAVSTYEAALAALKNESERQNSANETALKEEAKSTVEKETAEATATVSSRSYLTQEDQERYRILIMTLAQTAQADITSAQTAQAVEEALTTFRNAVKDLQSQIDSANTDSQKAGIEKALSDVEALKTAAINALSAYTFLETSDVTSFTEQINAKAAAAKDEIEKIGNITEIEGKINALSAALAEIGTNAANTNSGNETAAKNEALNSLETKKNAASTALDALSSLKDENFAEELTVAYNQAKTRIHDATTPAAIDSVKEQFNGTADDILARATLQNAKNEATASAEGKAKEATETVEGYDAFESKQTYLDKITAALDAARSKIEAAENSEQAQAAVTELDATLESIKAEAASDFNNAELAKAKAEARARFTTARTTHAEALEKLLFLTESEKNTYRAEMTEAVEAAETSLATAEQTAIEGIVSSLEAKLAEIEGKAKTADGEKETTLKEAATKEVEEAKAVAANIQRPFLPSDAQTTYTNALDDALTQAQESIKGAETPEEIENAKATFNAAVDNAKQAASKANTDERSKQIAEASKAVEDALNAAIGEVKKVTFVDPTGYITQLRAAANTAREGLTNVEEPDEIATVKTTFTAACDTITGDATKANTDAKTAAVEKAQATVGENSKKTTDACGALGFLAENAYAEQIASAVTAANEAIGTATDQGKINDALAELNKALEQIEADATAENAQTAANAKKEATDAIHEAESDANALAESWHFLDETRKQTYQDAIGAAVTTAVDAIEAAENQNEIDAATAKFNSNVQAQQTSAGNENDQIKTSAQTAANETVKDETESANAALEALGFIDTKESLNSVTAASDTAKTDIQNATTQTDIDNALTTLRSLLKGITSTAEADNETARQRAVDKAKGKIAEAQENAKSLFSSLGFISEEDYAYVIDSAVASATEAVEAAKSQAEIDEALSTLNAALDGVHERAKNANDPASEYVKGVANGTVNSEAEAAKGTVGAFGFVGHETYNSQIEAAVTNAENAIEAAVDQSGIDTALDTFRNAVNGTVTAAETANNSAKEVAVQAAKEEIDNAKGKANSTIEALRYLDPKTSYTDRLTQALADADAAFETAQNFEDVNKAKQAALDAIQGALADAQKANLSAAIDSAKSFLKGLYDALVKLIRSRGFLRDGAEYVTLSVNEEITKQSLLTEAETAYDAALAKLDGTDLSVEQVESIQSDAETELKSIETTTNNTNKANEASVKADAKAELQAAKDAATAAIDGSKFLSEGDRATRKSEIETQYNAAVKVVEEAKSFNGVKTESFTSAAKAASEKAASDNVAALKKEVESEADGMKATIDALPLSDEKKEEFKAEVDNVLNDAQGKIEASSADLDGIFKAFQEAVKYIGEEADKASKEEPEDEPVQVVVEGIRAIGKAYDATDSVEFDVTQVVYRNAKTGEEIDGTLFELSVSGRLSGYHVGKQVALITSITLSGMGVDAGEYVLSMRGQQAFAEVEVEQARLIVRVNSDGTVGYDGFVGGDDESVLSGKLELTYTQNADGTITVTPCGLESLDYDIEFVSGIISAPNFSGLWIALAATALVSAAFVGYILLKKKRR